jgi:hypothetical protein
MGITLNIPLGGVIVEGSVTLKQIIQKRLEYVRYGVVVPKQDIPLEYVAYDPITAGNTLFIADLSGKIPENSQVATYSFNKVSTYSGNSLLLDTKDVLITNQYRTKEDGTIEPFFYAHQLPDDTENVSIQKVTNNGGELLSTSLYSFSLGTNRVYAAFRNYFDETSGRFTLYYAESVDTAGNVTTELWDGGPAYHVAGFDDIDPLTGWLYADSNAYVINPSGSQWHFSMPATDTYIVKGHTDNLIQVLEPTLQTAEDPWFVEVTNGTFSGIINGQMRNFAVPEYEMQNFTPWYGYMVATWEKALKIDKNTLKLQRENVWVSHTDLMELEVVVLDKSKEVIHAFTTDPDRDGIRYSNTDVYYDYNVISSWDNTGGIVSLVDFNIRDSYELRVSYFYKADTYIFTDYNLNPLYNDEILDYMFVVYIVPDVPAGDHAIYYLLVKNNLIYYCSQTGNPVPNLSKYNSDGTLNAASVVGWEYEGEGSGAESFQAVYPHYVVLAEINGLQPERPDGGKKRVASSS